MKPILITLFVLTTKLAIAQDFVFHGKEVQSIEIESYYRKTSLDQNNVPSTKESFLITSLTQTQPECEYLKYNLISQRNKHPDTTIIESNSNCNGVESALIGNFLKSLESSKIYTLKELEISEDSLRVIANQAFSNEIFSSEWPWEEDAIILKSVFEEIDSLEQDFNEYLRSNWEIKLSDDGTFANSISVKVSAHDTDFIYWSNHYTLFQPMNYYTESGVNSVFNIKTRGYLCQILPQYFFSRKFLTFTSLIPDYVRWHELMRYLKSRD